MASLLCMVGNVILKYKRLYYPTSHSSWLILVFCFISFSTRFSIFLFSSLCFLIATRNLRFFSSFFMCSSSCARSFPFTFNTLVSSTSLAKISSMSSSFSWIAFFWIIKNDYGEIFPFVVYKEKDITGSIINRQKKINLIAVVATSHVVSC